MGESARISVTSDQAGSVRARVLVVDDSAVSRAHIVATLEPLADAGAVESGAQALGALRDGGYAVVLCDYEMPDMSGLQLLRFLRAKHTALELPVLLLTGSEDPDVKVRAFRAGANDYISKQAAAEELVARVRTQLDLLDAQRRLTQANARHAEGQKFEAMGQLTEALAHELNTPAQYIGDNLAFLLESFDGFRNLINDLRRHGGADSAYTERLIEGADCDYLFAEIPRCIVHSRQGLAHISGVVSVMGEFSQRGQHETGVHDLNSIVKGAVAVTRGRWHEVAELSLELQEPMAPVHCVATAMKQVMLYAIMNAIKAMSPEDGMQRARGQLRIRSHTEGNWAEVEIADNGRGIAAERLAKMLDPKFASSLPDAAAQALTQIRSVVVVDHGGQLEVSSTADEGTHVIMRVPLQR